MSWHCSITFSWCFGVGKAFLCRNWKILLLLVGRFIINTSCFCCYKEEGSKLFAIWFIFPHPLVQLIEHHINSATAVYRNVFIKVAEITTSNNLIKLNGDLFSSQMCMTCRSCLRWLNFKERWSCQIGQPRKMILSFLSLLVY